MNYDNIPEMFDALEVAKVPSGFVNMGDGKWENGLHIFPFESQITFVDSEEVSFFSTGFNNSDFIVKHEGEYYINEKNF